MLLYSLQETERCYQKCYAWYKYLVKCIVEKVPLKSGTQDSRTSWPVLLFPGGYLALSYQPPPSPPPPRPLTLVTLLFIYWHSPPLLCLFYSAFPLHYLLSLITHSGCSPKSSPTHSILSCVFMICKIIVSFLLLSLAVYATSCSLGSIISCHCISVYGQ